MNQRLYRRGDRPELLRFVADRARQRWPASAYLTPGDVAWRLPGAAPEENLCLWYDGARLVGYLWFDPPTAMTFDGPLRAELLVWGAARRRDFGPGRPRFLDVRSMAEWEQELRHPRPTRHEGVVLETTALESDRPRAVFLEANGFVASQQVVPMLRRRLDVPIPPSRLPAGFRLRHVTEADVAERVAAHRDAFGPRSSFTLERYLAVRADAPYDPELDLVLETPHGTFASYCIAWPAPGVGVGSFEPVGTRRAWRGRGFAREVLWEGMRRLKAKGMHTALVETAGFNEPAQAAYRSAGFELVDVARTFLKTLDEPGGSSY
jgi:ribosomal protein S18 acetylase RimI-like enzyme